MATRSTIALEFVDGTIGQVYCHWDGYLGHNGRLLLEHWHDPAKVSELIDHGNLSSLGATIGVKHPFENPHVWGTTDYVEFRKQFENMCLFYGRDRGEGDAGAVRYDNYRQYLDECHHEEFNYILRHCDGVPTWFVQSYLTNDKFIPLEEAIEIERLENEAAEG